MSNRHLLAVYLLSGLLVHCAKKSDSPSSPAPVKGACTTELAYQHVNTRATLNVVKAKASEMDLWSVDLECRKLEGLMPEGMKGCVLADGRMASLEEDLKECKQVKTDFDLEKPEAATPAPLASEKPEPRPVPVTDPAALLGLNSVVAQTADIKLGTARSKRFCDGAEASSGKVCCELSITELGVAPKDEVIVSSQERTVFSSDAIGGAALRNSDGGLIFVTCGEGPDGRPTAGQIETAFGGIFKVVSIVVEPESKTISR